MLAPITLLAAAILSAPAGAQPAPAAAAKSSAQTLGECLVMKSTGADRLLVARWLLASIASAPQVAAVATVRPGQKVVADQGMAALFTRLLAKDCAAEARPVFAAQSTEGFRIAGGALGRVAMEELLNDPQAQAGIEEYVKYLKKDDFKSVLP